MSAGSDGKRPDLVESVEKWAASLPDGVALRFEGEAITYEELNRRANRVANGLQGMGVEKGDRVAIMLPNIPEFVYAFVATLKLGR